MQLQFSQSWEVQLVRWVYLDTRGIGYNLMKHANASILVLWHSLSCALMHFSCLPLIVHSPAVNYTVHQSLSFIESSVACIQAPLVACYCIARKFLHRMDHHNSNHCHGCNRHHGLCCSKKKKQTFQRK